MQILCPGLLRLHEAALGLGFGCDAIALANTKQGESCVVLTPHDLDWLISLDMPQNGARYRGL